MRCTNCNQILDEDSVFCPECGSNVAEMKAALAASGNDDAVQEVTEAVQMQAPVKKFCYACGTEYEEGDGFCGGCGRNLNEKYVPENPNDKNAAEKKARTRAKSALTMKANKKAIAGIAAVIIVIVLGVILIPKLSFGKKDAKGQLFYLKDNELFKNKGKNNIPVADDIFKDEDDIAYIQYDMCLSDDGKNFFYPVKYEDSRFDLYFKNPNSEKDKGTKIDSDVSNYSLIGNDRVIYIKGESADKLYISDLKGNKEKVASDAAGYYISDNHKSIVYTVKDDDGKKLYVVDSKLKKGAEKLDSGVDSIIYVSKDLKQIYYTKDGSLYVCMNMSEKEKIASDVADAFATSDDKDVPHLYYVVSSNESDYISISKYLEEDVALDSYEATELKSMIENALCNFVSRELYYYSADTGSVLLAEGKFDYRRTSRGGVVYNVATGTPDKKMKLSKLLEMSSEEREAEITHANASSSILRINTKGQDITVVYDTDEYAAFGGVWANSVMSGSRYDEDNNITYITLINPSDGEWSLFKVNMKGDGTAIKIDDNVRNDFGSAIDIADGVAYYLVDYDEKNYCGDLYADGEYVDSDVCYVAESVDGKYAQYNKDREDNGSTTVMLTKGTDKIKIADDVRYTSASENGDIAVICDFDVDDNTGDLMLYHNKKLKKIDKDVSLARIID